ncbi:CAAD domain-containing protein [Richelia sinica]|nr:CAAD domain-containing protein [Richelia sinica]
MTNIMEPQEQQTVSVNSGSQQGILDLDGVETANLPKLPPATAPESQWQQIFGQITDFLDKLPDYIGGLFNNNKQALLTFFLILSALITVRVVLALLSAVNSIPLLEPTFEMIGLGYAIWFSFRYLLKSENRRELVDKFSWLKQQTLG